jgi:hypothetical protein
MPDSTKPCVVIIDPSLHSPDGHHLGVLKRFQTELAKFQLGSVSLVSLRASEELSHKANLRLRRRGRHAGLLSRERLLSAMPSVQRVILTTARAEAHLLILRTTAQEGTKTVFTVKSVDARLQAPEPHGGRWSRPPEQIRNAGFSRSSFGNVTMPAGQPFPPPCRCFRRKGDQRCSRGRMASPRTACR